MRLERLVEAAALFEKVLGRYPASPEVALQIGSAYLMGGSRPEARIHLERALELNPKYVEAMLALAQYEGQAGNYDRALELLEEAGREAPTRAEPLYFRGAALDLLGRTEEAIEAAARAVSLVPGDPQLRRFLGGLYLKQEKWPLAESELQAAIDRGGAAPDVFFDLGRAHLGQEELVLAEASFRRSLELHPGSGEALLQLGYIAWRFSKHEEALRLLERAIEMDPDLMRAYHVVGLIALRNNELERAEGYFRQAIDRDPTFSEAYFNLGKIALRRDELERAVELFDKAVELAPDYKEALYRLGFTHRLLGNEAAAAAALARFEALSRQEASSR